MRVRLELLWIEEYFIESGFELSMYLSNKFGSFGTWLGFESKQRKREGREQREEGGGSSWCDGSWKRKDGAMQIVKMV